MDTDLIRKLEELLNQQALCNGSSVKIIEMDETRVVVKLPGTCKGCPGAEITGADILETIIKEHIPTVQEVILDNSCDEELISFAKQLLNHGRQVRL